MVKKNPPLEEYAISINYRLVKDEHYHERLDALQSNLFDRGFVDNITTSSLYLYSLYDVEIESILLDVGIMLRVEENSNPDDVVVIRETRYVNKRTNGKLRRRVKNRTYVLAPNKDWWIEVNEWKLYHFLRDLD